MNKVIVIWAIAILMLLGCKKNTFKTTERESPAGKALLKVGLFNMSVTPSPLVIFNNSTKVSPQLSIPFAYPGGGFNVGGSVNADYMALTPGSNKFEFVTMLANSNFIQSKVFETNQNIEANKKYTLFIADTASNTTAVLLEDNAPLTVDSGYMRLRFVNLIPNSPAMDLYKNDSLIVSNVTYKNVSSYVDVPSILADSFAVRPTGTPKGYAVNATAYYRLVLNTNQRILNIVARGFIGTTAPRIASVTVLLSK